MLKKKIKKKKEEEKKKINKVTQKGKKNKIVNEKNKEKVRSYAIANLNAPKKSTQNRIKKILKFDEVR